MENQPEGIELAGVVNHQPNPQPPGQVHILFQIQIWLWEMLLELANWIEPLTWIMEGPLLVLLTVWQFLGIPILFAEPCLKVGFRWLVKHAKYFRRLLRAASFLCLTHFTYMVFFWFFITNGHSLTADDIDSRCKTLGALLTCFLIFSGYFFSWRYRLWVDQVIIENDAAGKFFPASLENILRFSCGTSFAIASMYGGELIEENPVELHILFALVGFIVFLSLSFWRTDDFGASDAVIAVILGAIFNLEKFHNQDHCDKHVKYHKVRKIHLWLAAGIPASKFLLVPLGKRIVTWVGDFNPNNAEDQPVCPIWLGARVVKILLLTVCLIIYWCINIVKLCKFEHYLKP